MQTLLAKAKEKISYFWNEAVLGNTEDVGKQPAPVEMANEVTQIHGLHNILRYDQYDESTGLFYNDNSVAFCFEVIAQTGADENMVARLNTIFTPIPPNFGLQWCLFGSPILDAQFQAYIDQRHIAVDRGKTPPLFLELAKRRVNYIKRNTGRPLFSGDNFTVKNMRLLFSVTQTGSHENSKLIEEMTDLRETLHASLRTAHLPAFSLDADGLINFLWPILNPESMFNGEPSSTLHYDEGKSIKEQVTAFGHHARVKSGEILFGLPPEDKGEADNRIAMRGFGVRQYPKKKELWEMANIIGAFFNDGLQYPCPFLICGGVFTLDQNTVSNKAQLKAARAKQNAASKMAIFQPELGLQAQDWNTVVHQLENGGQMCEVYHTLLLFAPKKTINRASQIALNIWDSENFKICQLHMLQLATLYASLPMTLTQAVRDDLKKLRLISTKTTVNAVDMAPIIGEWKGAGDPVMMFFGRRGTPTFLDFYANPQGNYNLFVAGVSGSGKTFALNNIVSDHRSIGAIVRIIDVGRGYRNLIALQKGTFLEFTPRSDLCLNPFTWVGMDPEITLEEELNFLKPIIARMAAPNTELDDFQYSLIAEAITEVWNQHGQDSNPTLISEYLIKNIKNEKGEIERTAFELGKQLQPFTERGVYGRYFNGRANLALDNDMIGLELEELKNMPDLRRVVLLVLMTRISNDMYLTSREQKKLCLIDEAWQLLGEDKETASFIEEGYRRARKYNGIFALGTQSIEDAFKNDASKAAWNNADWKIILRQEEKDLKRMIAAGTVDFTAAEKRMLLSLRTEEGRFSEMLISSPYGQTVVRNIPDPFTLLMASSRGADFNECEELLKQGYPIMQALETMLERRGYRDAA